MKKWRLYALAFLLLLGGASAALAEGVVSEVWRGHHGEARLLAVDPRDGSAWAYVGRSVLHYDAAGSLVKQLTQYDCVLALAVDPNDSSVWLSSAVTPELVHLAADGTELWRGWTRPAGLIAVDPSDSTIWVQPCDDRSHASFVHLTTEGQQLWEFASPATDVAEWRYLVVSPDGTLWVAGQRTGTAVVRHLASDGTELWGIDPVAGAPMGITVSPLDGSCWIGTDTGLLHVSAGNAILWSRSGVVAWGVTVDPADDSCWYTTEEFPATPGIVHVAANGAESLRVSGFEWQLQRLTFSPADGSLWATSERGVVHFAADGTWLQQDRGLGYLEALALDPQGGGYWLGRTEHTGLGATYAYWVSCYDGSGQEQWSQPQDAAVYSLAFDAADRSVWAAEGSTLVHLAADGTELPWPVTFDPLIYSVLLDPLDRSLWVSDASGRLYHYTSGGEPLPSVPVSDALSLPVISPHDGSIWAVVRRGDEWEPDDVLRIARDGSVVVLAGFTNPSSIRIDPYDGSAWVSGTYSSFHDPGDPCTISHLTADGSLLWQGTVNDVWMIAVDPRTGVCWATGYATVLLSPTGQVLGSVGTGRLWEYYPTEAAADAIGQLWTLDYESEMVRFAAALGPFWDLPADFWAADEIAACEDAGIVAGYRDRTYQPKRAVTRGQMAAFIARAMCGGDALVPTGPAEATFPDVPATSTFFRHVEFAYSEGVVTGYKDGTYQPDMVVNRGQMAAFLARALVGGEAYLPTGPAEASFSDVATDFSFFRHIEHIYRQNITTGYKDGTFHPEYPCPRDQMAVFVARAFHLLP